MKNIEIIKTKDGSIGLYNKDLDEVYHSIYGAKKEAFEKFIEPALVLKNKKLKILDICYGIGYNTKSALEYFSNIDFIDCVEIDEELAKKSYEFEFCTEINKIIKDGIENKNNIHFYFEDIRKFIKHCDKKYDLIFHDGFAPHKQSELWSEDLINEIISKLDKEGLYCTYNHSKPVLCALYKTKINVGKTIKDNNLIGTVASYDVSMLKNPINAFEIGILNTKSAITYKDRNLDLTHSEIIKNRNTEVQNSNLISQSHYLKIHKNNTEV